MGNLRCQFDQNWKIDLLELTTVEHSEYVPRQQLLRSAAESPDIKLSPNTSKASGKRAQQQRQKQQHAQDQPAPKPVPSSMVTEYGMTEGAQTYLEVSSLEILLLHYKLTKIQHFSWQKPCQSWPISSTSHKTMSTSPPLTPLPNTAITSPPNNNNNSNSNSSSTNSCYNSNSSTNTNYNNKVNTRNLTLNFTIKANSSTI